MKNNKDGISVIIPTFNRASFLYPTLVCLSNQKLDANINYEVIVVDSGNDKSKLIVKHFIEQKPKIFYYKKIKYCSNRALLRNTGVALTNYNLILFLDNDMLVPPEYLQVHYNVHKENKNLIVCGRRRTLVNFKLNEIGEDILMYNFSLLEKLPWYDDERLKQNIGFESWRYFYTHSMSVGKDLFLKAGGFTNKFGNVWGGEDIEASYKMSQKGAEFKFLTEPVIYHQGHFSQSTSEQPSGISSSRLFVKLHNTYQAELFLALPTPSFSFVYENAFIAIENYHKSTKQEFPSKNTLKYFDLVLGVVFGFEDENLKTNQKKLRLGVFLPQKNQTVVKTLILNSIFKFPSDIQACIISEAFRVSKNIFFEESAKIEDITKIAQQTGIEVIVEKTGKYFVASIKKYIGNGSVYILLPDVLSPQKRFVFESLASKLIQNGKRVSLGDKRNSENLSEEDYALNSEEAEKLSKYFRLCYGSIPCTYITPYSATYNNSIYVFPNTKNNFIIREEDFSVMPFTSLPARFSNSRMIDAESYSLAAFSTVKDAIDSCKKYLTYPVQEEYDFCYFAENGYYEDSIKEILTVFQTYVIENRKAKLLVKLPDYKNQLKYAYPFHNECSKKMKLMLTDHKFQSDFNNIENRIKELGITDNVTILHENLKFEKIISLILKSRVLLSLSKIITTGPEVYAALLLNKHVIIPEHYIIASELRKYCTVIHSDEKLASSALDLPCTSKNIRYRLYDFDFDSLLKTFIESNYRTEKIPEETIQMLYQKFINIMQCFL